MREIISLYFGKCGNSIGESVRQIYRSEYCNEDGKEFLPDFGYGYNEPWQTFLFEDKFEGKDKIHRGLCIDSDVITAGDMGKRFQLSCENPSSSVTFCAGSKMKKLLDKAIDLIRKLSETCTSLQGFQFFHSSGGGMSGCMSSLVLSLLDNYGKKVRNAFTILPNFLNKPSAFSIYNSALCFSQTLIDHMDTVLLFSNSKLEAICSKLLKKEKKPGAKLEHLNELITQVISSSTTSQRFDGALNVDLSEFQTGLVPYPRLHFITPSFSFQKAKTVDQLVDQVFDGENMLLHQGENCGSYMSCMLAFRGDVTPREINASLQLQKGKVKFVEWAPTGFKTGVNYMPPGHLPGWKLLPKYEKVALLLANSSSVKVSLEEIYSNLEKCVSKKSFLHWYSESFDLQEVMENGKQLIDDYNEVEREEWTEDDEEGYDDEGEDDGEDVC